MKVPRGLRGRGRWWFQGVGTWLASGRQVVGLKAIESTCRPPARNVRTTCRRVHIHDSHSRSPGLGKKEEGGLGHAWRVGRCSAGRIRGPSSLCSARHRVNLRSRARFLEQTRHEFRTCDARCRASVREGREIVAPKTDLAYRIDAGIAMPSSIRLARILDSKTSVERALSGSIRRDMVGSFITQTQRVRNSVL